MRMRSLILLWALSPTCLSQNAAIDATARKSIEAGNQAWVDGMKSGRVGPVADTFTEDAVDCGATGECARGRAPILKEMEARIAKYGRANAASVHSAGSVQQGELVYEWGRSEASFSNGSRIGGRYLTVWRRQSDGTWKIFRNMPMPADAQH